MFDINTVIYKNARRFFTTLTSLAPALWNVKWYNKMQCNPSTLEKDQLAHTETKMRHNEGIYISVVPMWQFSGQLMRKCLKRLRYSPWNFVTCMYKNVRKDSTQLGVNTLDILRYRIYLSTQYSSKYVYTEKSTPYMFWFKSLGVLHYCVFGLFYEPAKLDEVGLHE